MSRNFRDFRTATKLVGYSVPLLLASSNDAKGRETKIRISDNGLKKTREYKLARIAQLQKDADNLRFCCLIEVGHMQDAHVKTLNNLLSRFARLYFGPGAVVAKALGKTPDGNIRLGAIAKYIEKERVGLLFTDSEPDGMLELLKDFHKLDFARSGDRASRSVILRAGPVMQHHSKPPEPFPHNEEPQLRKLGLSTVIRDGVPTLEKPHKLCNEREVLTAEQAQLLKLIGEKVVEIRVRLKALWDSETEEGEVLSADYDSELDVEYDGDSD